LPQIKLKGSGGAVTAEVTEEQAKKADLGVGELFLAPVGRLDEQKISKYYCKNCDAEFEKSPKIEFENPDEEVAPGMILKEKGQYTCQQCNSMIGEYREFLKQE
jgi:DNA-directed RNA polymerase subunit RPC12/RpoP